MLAWKKTSSLRIRQFYSKRLTNYQALCPENCPVWQARYYDHNVEGDEAVNQKIEYMHNNPVEADLVATALEWKWSSVRFYVCGEAGGVTVSHCI
jgi:putative transposase